MLLLFSPAAQAYDKARDTYLMRCGGCHGIEGVSVPGFIPNLRDHAGIFLCTQEGRDYMLRLPNVAMSRIDNDALLAQVLNFVAFDLGGHSAPPRAPQFTAADVHAARGQVLDTTNFYALRQGVLARATAACSPHG